MAETRLELACKKIEFAREYTNSLLADIDPKDWFRQPTEGVTHVDKVLGLGMEAGESWRDADVTCDDDVAPLPLDALDAGQTCKG